MKLLIAIPLFFSVLAFGEYIDFHPSDWQQKGDVVTKIDNKQLAFCTSLSRQQKSGLYLYERLLRTQRFETSVAISSIVRGEPDAGITVRWNPKTYATIMRDTRGWVLKAYIDNRLVAQESRIDTSDRTIRAGFITTNDGRVQAWVDGKLLGVFTCPTPPRLSVGLNCRTKGVRGARTELAGFFAK